MPTDPVFVAGDYKNIIFFLFPREITVMRDSSRDFSLENTIFLYTEKGRKKERKGKRRRRKKKSFTTDTAKILKSIKIIECKMTIGFFFTSV